MSSDLLTLNCLVLGNSPPSDFVFVVNIQGNRTVDDLRATIKAECQNVLDFDEDLLAIWSASIVMDDNFNTKLADFQPSFYNGCRKRKIGTELADIFIGGPGREHLNIIVQPPDDERSRLKQHRLRSVPPEPSANISLRNATVSALFEKVFEHDYPKIIQVRGTPGSGKTTLALLLGQYIKRLRPNMPVIWVDGWRSRESRSWSSYLRNKGWKKHDETVFIFNDAQMTYWDVQLWNSFFKSIHDFDCYVIVFASYGSPTSLDVRNTNMFLPKHQRVTLRRVDYKYGLQPVGVLLMRPEFDDLISKCYPPERHPFDIIFLDSVFSLTIGHAGAVSDLLKVTISPEDGGLKLSTKSHTWEDFSFTVDPRQLLKGLGQGDAFRKGMPLITDIEVPAIARVLSEVLHTGFVMETDFKNEDDKAALQQCFHKGWLHADELDDFGIPYKTGYLFPSPLHRWFVEWTLWETFPDITFDAKDLLTFALEVISRFCPDNLTKNHRVGPGCIQRPPKAQYQDEFYRCSRDLSNDSIVTFPEFGIGNGRADLYIPPKKWGVEILRNGDQLEQHSGRFSLSESYAGSFPFDDHIILDFSDCRPAVAHHNLPHLYHVVFSEEFLHVSILDNNLEFVPGGEFALVLSSV